MFQFMHCQWQLFDSYYTGTGGQLIPVCLSSCFFFDIFDQVLLQGWGPQVQDQSFDHPHNKALQVTFNLKRPVRVIRGHGEHSNKKYAPPEGKYRYDGLYKIVEVCALLSTSRIWTDIWYRQERLKEKVESWFVSSGLRWVIPVVVMLGCCWLDGMVEASKSASSYTQFWMNIGRFIPELLLLHCATVLNVLNLAHFCWYHSLIPLVNPLSLCSPEICVPACFTYATFLSGWNQL